MYRKKAKLDRTRSSSNPLKAKDEACASSALRLSNEFSIRFRSNELTRWFIAVDRAEKLKSFPYPNISDTRTHTDSVGVNEHLTKNVVHLTSRLLLEADVKNGIGIAKEVHYATDIRLCVYGFFLKASRMPGLLRWMLISS